MFVDTGLIHLMVGSGTHLVFVEMLIWIFPRPVRLAILGFYCFLTGFSAPAVRAFVRRLIGPWFKRRSGFTSLQVEAATVVLTIAFVPEWIVSRSFLMSWMCGLAMTTPKLIPKWPHLDRSLKAYLFLFPFCWAAPVTVAWNALLAPVVGLILFPACLAAILVPHFSGLTDLMWRALLGMLTIGPQGSPAPLFMPAYELVWLPLLVHIFFLSWEVRWRRASAFSC